MRVRPSVPFRLWAPARFRTLVSIVAASAAGLVPAVMLPARPAYAAAGEIIIEADIEDAEAGTFVFEVRRLGPTTGLGSVTLTYDTVTSPSSDLVGATPNVDFHTISGSTTFSESGRDSIKRLTVTGITDPNDEYDERFALRLFNPNGSLLTEAYGTMLDDDVPPTYTLGTPVTVGESDGTASLTATLSDFSAKEVRIPYATADGSATPADYTPVTDVLVIPPESPTGTFTVPILPDARDELSPETLTVTTGTPVNATTTANTAQVRITDDDDPPVVGIGAPPDAAEGDPLKFPVSLSAASNLPVTVSAATNGNGDATADDDYTPVAPTTITFSPGDVAKTFEVPTTGDLDPESPETVGVTLSGPSQATLDPAATSVLGNIVDNAVTVTAVGTLDESSHTQAFDVTLTAAPATAIDIGWAASAGAGSATDGKDFDADSGTLTFEPGESTKRIGVDIRADEVYEFGGETFEIALTNTDNARISGFTSPTTFTLPDDDPEPTLDAFTSTGPQAEGDSAGAVTFTATLSNPTNVPVTLNLGSTDGTATSVSTGDPGDDDFAVPATLVIAADALSGTQNVTVNGDEVFESDESAVISATVDSDATQVAQGSRSGALTLINDDDMPSVALAPVAGVEDIPSALTATVTGDAQAPLNYTAVLAGAPDGTSDPAEPTDFATGGMSLIGPLNPGDHLIDLGSVGLTTDTIDEYAETIRVSLSLGGQTPAVNYVTIADDTDDKEPIVSIGSPISVIEDDGPAEVPVTLDFDHDSNDADRTEKTIEVAYETGTGAGMTPATADGDYTAVTDGTLIFDPATDLLVKNIEVGIADDEDYELGETFDVDLTAAPLAYAFAPSSSIVTITNDDDPPGFEVTPSSAQPVAEGGTASFTVTLDAPAVAPVNFTLVTTPVAPMTGADYTTPAGTFQIGANQQSATVTVQTAVDTVDEPDEALTVRFALDGAETDATGGPIDRTVTITDDDPVPTLAFANPFTGTEGDTEELVATVTGSAQAPIGYIATVTGVGGTAAAAGMTNPVQAADLDGSGLTLTGNLTSGATTLDLGDLLLKNDTIDEYDQTVKITVTLAGQTPVETTVTIADDDDDLPPEVSADASVAVAENLGPAAVPVTLDFAQDGNDADSTEKTIVVGYATAVGTATAGADYTATANGTLSFDPATDSLTKDIEIAVTNDADYELAETFGVTLTSAPLADTISQADSTVTITNDDTAPGFTITPASPVPVAEGAAATLTVTLAADAVAPVDFTVVTTDGTTIGADYTTPAGTFRIPVNQRTATVSLQTFADLVDEPDEDLTVTIALDGAETDAIGGPVNRTISITDDDPAPTLSFAGPITGTEGDTKALVATVTGTAQSPIAFTATVTGVGGTAAAAGMTNPVQAGDIEGSGLTLTGNLAPGASMINLGGLVLRDDLIDEDAQTAEVSITLAGQSPVTTTVTITDNVDDAEPAVVGPGSLAVAETNPATLPVTLAFAGATTSTEKEVTVRYATTAGTATAADFTGATDQLLTFTPGNGTANISIPVVADTLHENNEQFALTLSGQNAAASAITTPQSTITITDDDSTVPEFTLSAESPVVEGGTATYTVELGSAAAEDIDFDVTLTGSGAAATTDGGSDPGKDDFGTVAATATVLKDATTATISIPATGDNVYEGAETATLSVEPASTEDDVADLTRTRAVTINDADPVPTVALNVANGDFYAVAEAGHFYVTATTTGVAERNMDYSISVDGYGLNGENPAEPADYQVEDATDTIPGGSASGTSWTVGHVRFLADTVDEATETITVTAHNDTSATADVSTHYKITDDVNDRPPTPSLGPVTIAEGAGPASVPVTLSYADNQALSTEQDLTLSYEVLAGSAAANDFGTPTSTNPLIITAGSPSGAIVVPITDDLRYEQNETFQVHATEVGPLGAALGTDTATVTITDNDQNYPRPSFTVGSAFASESSTGATFTVTLSGVAQDDVDFTVSMADGSATGSGTGPGGDDFDDPSGTLRIAQGSLTGSISVPLRSDTVHEGDETAQLTVALAAGEQDATGSAQQGTLGIADDDARPTIALKPGSGAEGERVSITGVVTGTGQRSLGFGTLSGTGAGDAAAGAADYQLPTSSVYVSGGTSSGSTVDLGSIALASDTVDENTESVVVSLGGQTATYRITDDPDDTPPTITISDEDTRESSASVDLTVSLGFAGSTTATERRITVPWRTVAGTAEAGSDFTTSSGTVSFAPPDTRSIVSIPLLHDNLKESDQTFTVRFGTPSPSDVKTAKAEGTVTIADDDKAKTPTLTVPFTVVNGSVRMTLSGTAGAGSAVELLGAPGLTGNTWRVISTTEADTDGAYSFRPNFTQGYRLAVRADDLVSATRIVQIAQQPVLAATSTAKGVVSLTVTGDPDKAGQAVTVQRLNSGDWDPVATGKLNADGTFTATQRSLRSGTSYSYRAVIAATASLGILAGTSPARSVRVR
ncbi:hypothetical protein FB565_002307 [Actinoplanes lutulentus]|uniref:Calx-beta domain-containing protein n=1 Tax=Actinoplanes lutulentus TaxID=1287878 RepID=A0A327ZFB8_9ACTN|nr:Calx-beta domain-containing protein [Actinoplanes lutulentus]MBB2942594.1 hypothetical protein [Actinoplanes lutulentus]RAK38175.1 Calx-beta domain-containing protein [Actinoplanes lutulentus]